jgi:hypothetical protein
MRNINRISRTRLLSCATVGLVVSISPCFAQGNRDASQDTAPLEITPFKCDSLDPKVCFDIYWRLHNEPAPPSLDRRFLPQPPNWSFVPNWSKKFEGLHYGLGTPNNMIGTVPFGRPPAAYNPQTGIFYMPPPGDNIFYIPPPGINYLFR